MSYREECDTCAWWHTENGIGQDRYGEWLIGGEDEQYGQCDQNGDETRYDQYCNLWKLHSGIARRNGWE